MSIDAIINKVIPDDDLILDLMAREVGGVAKGLQARLERDYDAL